jgi:uncharacterized protein (TIGR02145 family)
MKIILLLFVFLTGTIYAQIDPTTFPLFSSAERDSLKEVQTGYTILNSTTGCINYYFNKQWLEICGKCSPTPLEAKVDSILIEDGIVQLYFSPFVLGCKYQIFVQSFDQPIITEQSPVIANNLKLNSSYQFKCISSSKCGEVQSANWSSPISVKLKDYCNGLKEFTDPESKQTYELMSIGKSCWMKSSLVVEKSQIKGSKEIVLENSVAYFSWTAASNAVTNENKLIQGVCPSGFHLPLRVDVLNLIQAFRQNPHLSFFQNKMGLYDFKQKKLLSDIGYYYWTGDSNYFLLSQGGEPELMRMNELVGMPVKCIKN